MTFIDLEKAYDGIPKEEIWRCPRERNVPEKYIRQDMYQGCKTIVRSSAVESTLGGGRTTSKLGLQPIPVPTPVGCVDI